MNKQITTLATFVATWALTLAAQAETVRTEVVNQIVIERPIEEAFEYATTAENWKDWHPNTLKTAGADDHSATEGEEITEWIKFGAIPAGKFFWEVAEHDEPNTWALLGEAQGGLIRFELTYTFTRTPEGGTLFRRQLICELDKTPVTQLLARYFMEPYLKVSSQRALSNLKREIEAP